MRYLAQYFLFINGINDYKHPARQAIQGIFILYQYVKNSLPCLLASSIHKKFKIKIITPVVHLENRPRTPAYDMVILALYFFYLCMLQIFHCKRSSIQSATRSLA